MQNDKEELKLIQFLVGEINLTKNRLKNANESAIDIEIDLLNQQVISLYNAIKQYQNASSATQPAGPPKMETYIAPATAPIPVEKPKEEEKKPVVVEVEKPFELKPEPQTPTIKEEAPAEVQLEEQRATNQILEIKEEKKPEAMVIEYNTIAPEPAHEEKSDLTLNQKLQSNSESLNDKFAKQQTVKNLSDKLKLSPIDDLRSGISLNQKISFIKQLFGDNDKEYKQAVTFLNNSKNFSEAKFYVQQELAPKYKWDETNPVVEEFMELVYRKFL